EDRAARCAAVVLPSLVRNSPEEVTNTTPLMIVGVRGETRSREAQPGCKVNASFCSTSFQATTEPFVIAPLSALNPASAACAPVVGARIQRTPSAPCQLASAPGVKSFGPPCEENSGAFRFAVSNRCTLPVLLVTASSVLPL